MNTEPDILNIREAARYLRLSTDTLYGYASKGKVPAFKFGNRWRFKKSALNIWMDQQAELWKIRGEQKREEAEGK